MVGKSPVEFVFGRKPRDIVTIENSSHEQVSVPVTPHRSDGPDTSEIGNDIFCLEARQRADL
ncbi:MAG: hypothetical protein ACK53L_18095, partial [Pirellulaceae bacterium]